MKMRGDVLQPQPEVLLPCGLSATATSPIAHWLFLQSGCEPCQLQSVNAAGRLQQYYWILVVVSTSSTSYDI
jgi:hypothetical protein